MGVQNMTTSQIKKRLIDEMLKQESEAYVFGWLKSSYIHQYDEDTERHVAIKQLAKYEVTP